MKASNGTKSTLEKTWMDGYWKCDACGGLVEEASIYEGENEKGQMRFTDHFRCEDCGNSSYNERI